MHEFTSGESGLIKQTAEYVKDYMSQYDGSHDYAHIQLAVRIAHRLRVSQGMDAGIAAYGKLAAGTLGPIRARIGMQIGGAEALLWEPGDVEGMTTSLNSDS